MLCSNSNQSCLLSHCIFIQFQRIKLRRECRQLIVQTQCVHSSTPCQKAVDTSKATFLIKNPVVFLTAFLHFQLLQAFMRQQEFNDSCSNDYDERLPTLTDLLDRRIALIYHCQVQSSAGNRKTSLVTIQLKVDPELDMEIKLYCSILFKLQCRGFPGGAVVENLPANAGDTGSSPGLGGSHMPRSNWACEPQLLSLRVWSLCSATREATIVRGPRTAMKTGPRSPQLGKALAQKRRPNTAINK